MWWFALLTTALPVSMVWRRASRCVLFHSASSSRNSTPPWARLTSPGRARLPPPTSAAIEAEWCGSRNGLLMTRPPCSSLPASEWIIVASSASAGVSGGSNPGSRAASIDLPAPGGPIISRLWLPTAAISSARRAVNWPARSFILG